MSKPSLSLSMIVKNEAENLPRLAKSVEGCFDEWVIVDTGSTDDTVEVAKKLGARVEHFEWVNDFSAARNYGLSKVNTEYAWWMDGDDVLHNPQGFKEFWNNSMKYFDYILASYNYALHPETKAPVVAFMRERIFNMKLGPKFEYFVHEGVKPMPLARPHYCTNWAINHLRTDADMVKDRSRNLNIFKDKRTKGKLDGRMTFYYGKEFFENGEPDKAIPVLLDAFAMDMELHDRILCLQYACYAVMMEAEKMKPEHAGKKFTEALTLAHQGILLDPKRAEFHTIMGDCYLKMGKFSEAKACFGAAKYSSGLHAGDRFAPPIHTYRTLYEDYPRNQIGRILFQENKFIEAKKEVSESIELYKSVEGQKILEEMDRLVTALDIDSPKNKTEDIVFTCPPQSAYEFDEELYKIKGMGGSETALIEMATWLKRITGRPVKVFNMRQNAMVGTSGVEWIPTTQLNEYFSKNSPKLHIAWRHNIRVTKAPSYLWCHDLMIPGVENGLGQDKVLCLTPFHRDFLAGSQGVDRDKIILTRNGLNPQKFKGLKISQKDPNKFVYTSSPDRGLDRCMLILDKVRAKGYDIKLHVFYGLDNLYKYGLGPLADKLTAMMKERPWVIYHGFTEQRKMYENSQDAAVWCHPNDFIETSCITAMEMLAQGIYPITRRWGGISDTLAQAEKDQMARLLDIDSVTDEQHKVWADEVVKALEERAWERILIDTEEHSWESVAKSWIKMFDLSPEQKRGVESSHALQASP